MCQPISSLAAAKSRHHGNDDGWFPGVLYNLRVNLRTKMCLAAVLVLVLGILARAESVSQLQPTGYVNDFAHVLDQQTIAQMTDICQQIDQKAHAQIAVVTINSLDGADIESYAVDLFKKWGIGNKSTDHGVLILYAIRITAPASKWATDSNRFCPTERWEAFSVKRSR